MEDDNMRTSSDSEEAILNAIEEDDEDVRYRLRSRTVSRTQTPYVSVGIDPGSSQPKRDQAPIADARGASVAVTNGVRTEVTTIGTRPLIVSHGITLDSGARDRDVEEVRDGQRSSVGLMYAVSPFELIPARGWMSEGRTMTLGLSGRSGAHHPSEAQWSGEPRAGHRISLPFQYERRDIPYVPPVPRTSEMHDTAQGFLTRMTAREQGRTTVLERPVERPVLGAVPTWEEFHRTVDQRMMEGTRAIERIAAEAVHAGYEPDIHRDPHPLLDGGGTNADRLGPKSSIFGIRSPPNRVGVDVFDMFISHYHFKKLQLLSK
jgi:hypothetical protein